MKQILCLVALLSTYLSGCATTNNAHYREEKNTPKFGNSRSYVEGPEEVLGSAKAVLEDLNRESDPQATDAIKENQETVSTGWVYSTSSDKYVEFNFNGAMKRKPLKIRRKYSYSVTPNLAGSQVVLSAEEQVMKVDLKTGADKTWNSVETDKAAYDMMSRRLQEKLRSR